MNWLIGIAVIVACGLGGGLVWLVRRLSSPRTALPVTAGWIDELSVDRYRPMMRLLDGDDLEIIQAQPGCTPQKLSQVRQQRCHIFRGYLQCLSTDFQRVCMATKILLLQSQHDRPDLASALLRAQVLFTLGMAAVQLRLVLYSWGFCRVDVTDLVKIFDGMRVELRSLVPATLGMEA